MDGKNVEAAARRDVPSLRVRRPARFDRGLGDVELDIIIIIITCAQLYTIPRAPCDVLYVMP